MSGTQPKVLQQCGALPYIVTSDGVVKVLLVTSRGKRRWIIPKGWPIPDLSVAESAAREAFEEAGLLGAIIGTVPIGSYRYEKRHFDGELAIFEVAVFLFAVERQLRKWPEKAQRKTRWYDIGKASGLVRPGDLGEILRHTARLLTVAPDQTADSPGDQGRCEYQEPAETNIIPPIGGGTEAKRSDLSRRRRLIAAPG
jgi:8-oxo-dGTP pyrophosphatase MutT (NUDIX family)